MTEITTSWICLFCPLAAVVVIALGGNRFSRRAAGVISTGSVFLSFAAAVVAFSTMLTRAPTTARTSRRPGPGSPPGTSTSACRSSSTR